MKTENWQNSSEALFELAQALASVTVNHLLTVPTSKTAAIKQGVVALSRKEEMKAVLWL